MADWRTDIERVLETDPPNGEKGIHNRHLDSRTIYDLSTHPEIIHRKVVPHIKATPDVQFKEMADAGYYDPDHLVDLEMQPGEFILFNERTLHHSKANQSKLRRIGLAVRNIVPIVNVLRYDSPDHALPIVHGQDTMGFNKITDPPA